MGWSRQGAGAQALSVGWGGAGSVPGALARAGFEWQQLRNLFNQLASLEPPLDHPLDHPLAPLEPPLVNQLAASGPSLQPGRGGGGGGGYGPVGGGSAGCGEFCSGPAVGVGRALLVAPAVGAGGGRGVGPTPGSGHLFALVTRMVLPLDRPFAYTRMVRPRVTRIVPCDSECAL